MDCKTGFPVKGEPWWQKSITLRGKASFFQMPDVSIRGVKRFGPEMGLSYELSTSLPISFLLSFPISYNMGHLLWDE